MRNGVDIQLDKTQKHGGQQSVKIASTGPGGLPGEPAVFAAHHRPAVDGRLAPRGRCRTTAAVAIGDGGKSSTVATTIASPRSGWRRSPASPRSLIRRPWGQYVFQVDDLPLEGLTSLRVRFDLMGPGEVWIDDVQLFGLAFNRSELVELQKLITLADVKLQERPGGRLSPAAGRLLATVLGGERAGRRRLCPPRTR